MKRILTLLVALAIIGGAGFWFLTTPQRLGADDKPTRAPDATNPPVRRLVRVMIPVHLVADPAAWLRSHGMEPHSVDQVGDRRGDQVADCYLVPAVLGDVY